MRTHPSVRASFAVDVGIRYELKLFWAFIGGDLSSTLLPASLMTVAAWSVSNTPGSNLIFSLVRALIYFSLYIYIFCLSNQLMGIEEDQINKPHRPLVRGLVTPSGAMMRLSITLVAFVMLGVLLGVQGWTLLWVGATLAHNMWGLARHWTGKNFLMGVGIIAQLGAAWEMILPLTPLAWRWIGTIAWLMLPLVAIQDLRDMIGDRTMGRKTLPLVWGHWPVRIWLGSILVGLPALLHFSLFMPLGLGVAVVMCDALIAAVCWLLAARVIFLRTSRDDHTTYQIFTYWYCTMLLSAAVVF